MAHPALSAYELRRDTMAANTESIEQAPTAYINELERLRHYPRTRGVPEESVRAARLAGAAAEDGVES